MRRQRNTTFLLTFAHKFSTLENEVAELNAKLKWYEEQLKLNKKKMFGASSEKTDEACEQLKPLHTKEKVKEIVSKSGIFL